MAERESVYLWSISAGSNGNIDTSINFLEGQLPGTVNNSARSVLAAAARYIKDINGTIVTAGSGNAYTATTSETWSAHATGHMLGLKANHTNSGAATLSVVNADGSALGSKAIRTLGDLALVAGQVVTSAQYDLRYDASGNAASGAWMLLNPTVGPVKGTATNDSAAAGYVGEVVTSSRAAGSAVSLSNAVATTIISIPLTAGDWDVSGFVTYVKQPTTVVFSLLTSISEVADTRDTANESITTFNSAGETLDADPWTPAPLTRKLIASPTTIYLIARGGFNTSTLAAWGTIRARRMR